MTSRKFQQRGRHQRNVSERSARSIESARPSSLKPNPANARTHSEKQISKVAASIRDLGFNNPVLVNADNMIIAGHARVAAAKELGLERIPIVRLAHMSAAEVRAYVLADNRLAELSDWDSEILATELEALAALDLGFELELTGFSMPEIDQVIETSKGSPSETSTLDHSLEPLTQPVTRPGDIWCLGAHRLMCGNAFLAETYEALLAGEEADKIFVDPSFKIPVNGNSSGPGRNEHFEFAEASGELSSEEFSRLLTQALELHARHSRDGALHFVCQDWKHLGEVLDAGKVAYDTLLDLCVWNKQSGEIGSSSRSQYELVFVFKHGTAPYTNNNQLGRYGRHRTSLWEYPDTNSLGKMREEGLAPHPSVKPVQMVADAILDASNPGDVVLDGSAGSGTSLIAANEVRRRGFGVELDPTHCDVIVQRLAAASGEDAFHQESGLTFPELAAKRLPASEEASGNE